MTTYAVWCFEPLSHDVEIVWLDAESPGDAAIAWCRLNKLHEGAADIAVRDVDGKVRTFDVFIPSGPLTAGETHLESRGRW